ncbi:MAG: hypothetical protein KDE28_30420 [Anaerolineales bacterium]|nr:hypothetical protein [Anaerolineales bacterium]
MNPNAQPEAILVADTDETQAYVFESNKLPEIRGASLQLRELNEQAGEMFRHAVPGGQLVIADGGSLIGLGPATELAPLAERIEASYPIQTQAATISSTWRQLPPDYKEKDFSEVVNWAGNWLRRYKESKVAPPFWECLPAQTRCQSCQIRPAISYPGQLADWSLCQACKGKRDFERDNRDYWFTSFRAWLGQQQANTPFTTARAYFGEHRPGAVLPAHTLAEIGQASKGRAGYIGLIYLDGDQIGRVLQKIGSAANYVAFSKKLSRVTRDGVMAALARYLRPVAISGDEARREIGQGQLIGEQITIFPFEIITIGGDDVILIVPADHAIPLAQAIGSHFAAEMADRNLSMSAGVVLADDHTPVREMVNIAKQLVRQAKKLNGGGLDFHALVGSDTLDREIGKLRERYPYRLLQRDKTGQNLALLSRPYSYTEVEILWRGLERLKQQNVSTSQLNLLATSLLQGRNQSTLTFMYQLKRHGGDVQKIADLLTEIHQSQQPQSERAQQRNPALWQEVAEPDYKYRTALWDLAELFPFVGRDA